MHLSLSIIFRGFFDCTYLDISIERNLENYIPYALPPKHYYRALEERDFLFYRYIKGFTMLQVAELMCVSRDTVYRIQRRIAARDGLFSSVLDNA